MSLRRKGCRRRRPGEVVLIDAGIAVVALSDDGKQVYRQLQRRELRVAADLLSGDLIDRCAEVIIGALGPFGFGSAQERGVGSRVRPWIRVPQLQVRDYRDLLLHGRERAERRRKLIERL